MQQVVSVDTFVSLVDQVYYDVKQHLERVGHSHMAESSTRRAALAALENLKSLKSQYPLLLRRPLDRLAELTDNKAYEELAKHILGVQTRLEGLRGNMLTVTNDSERLGAAKCYHAIMDSLRSYPHKKPLSLLYIR